MGQLAAEISRLRSGGGGVGGVAGPPLAALFVPLLGVQVVETGKQFSQITPGSKRDVNRRSLDSS